ncbi:MAG: hypothetical protein AB9869_25935 [Verrucomicrobiia bacterium]
MMTICHQTPQHESQVRPLIGLKPEEAQLAWTCAVESAGGRKITARLVKRAMEELGFAAAPKPDSRIDRNAKAERRKLINDTTLEQNYLRICAQFAHTAGPITNHNFGRSWASPRNKRNWCQWEWAGYCLPKFCSPMQALFGKAARLRGDR